MLACDARTTGGGRCGAGRATTTAGRAGERLGRVGRRVGGRAGGRRSELPPELPVEEAPAGGRPTVPQMGVPYGALSSPRQSRCQQEQPRQPWALRQGSSAPRSVEGPLLDRGLGERVLPRDAAAAATVVDSAWSTGNRRRGCRPQEPRTATPRHATLRHTQPLTAAALAGPPGVPRRVPAGLPTPAIGVLCGTLRRRQRPRHDPGRGEPTAASTSSRHQPTPPSLTVRVGAPVCNSSGPRRPTGGPPGRHKARREGAACAV